MQKKLSMILIAVIFAAILVFANSKGLLGGVKNTLDVAVSPIATTFSGAGEGITVFFSSLFNLGKLQEENALLSDETNKLKSEVAQLKEVEVENASLRKDLGFTKKTSFDYEAATVMGYDPSNIREMVTLNKGSSEGLRVGMAVTSEGFLVGRISSVGENSSKVQLVTDPTSAIPVAIQGTKTNGIAKGQIGNGITMEKIPQGDSVRVGNTIISSGLGGEIPRGIIIGTVESVDSKENSLFVNAKIKVSSDIVNVLRVLVIKG